jgi:hypothetical protein
MATDAKITLSEPELNNVLDAEWILTKHRIIEKVYHLFNEQVPVIGGHFFEAGIAFGEEVRYGVPKISKGENYRQLPYVILDHPAVFGRDNIFALRTMFWWGNFFSITLLLKGIYREALEEKIYKNLHEDPAGFFVCINESEWEHHFEASNYAAAQEMTPAQFAALPFIKIAMKFELREWNNMQVLLTKGYGKFAKLMR